MKSFWLEVFRHKPIDLKSFQVFEYSASYFDWKTFICCSFLIKADAELGLNQKLLLSRELAV